MCDREFKWHHGLCVHRRRHHKGIPPLALRTRGTKCQACNAHMGTRLHLLTHLRARSACSIWIMANVTPMTDAEYHHEVNKLNQVDERLTRPNIPRSGPISWDGNKYTNQTITPINPFVDVDTDEDA
eukprot:4429854-Amphidinium_carterae.1